MSLLIHVLAFTGGFVIMSLELLGGRLLAPYFGNSIYVWGSIITVFMAALAVGYLIGGRISLHQPTVRKFALVFLAGAACVAPLALVATGVMDFVFDRIEDPRYGSLATATALFVAPSVVLGIISPYAVRLLVTTTHESGNVAGRLYFVSTLGSALGTLGTSFYFVLWFEMNTILYALAGALVIAASIAWFAQRDRSRDG